MQHTETHSDAELDLETTPPNRLRHRIAAILGFVLIVLLLAFIPPLINVSRLQQRIAHNISASIGRPVHFGRLTLGLLPSPGFTLENFVIDEDPAFGYEPILRADEVRATLRLSSFWTGHPEFSTISFGDGASVNIVHLSDGRWNIESLLFQASHIPAAPTAQRHAGPAPRFPYIEATAARVNLKLDQDKTPFSLDQSEFALWEPEPNQWHLRLSARPIRTDTAPSETGAVSMEGTLGAPNQTAGTLAATPIDLHGDWRDAQLGGLTQFVSGSDAGLRGAVSASFTLQGTVADNVIVTNISVRNAGRAEFVPPAPLSLDARCRAHASQTFHSFTGIACYWPPPDSAERSTLIIAAEVPDVRTPDAASVRVTLPAVPAATFFNWISIATRHPPIALAGPGTLSGELLWGLPDSSSPDRAQLDPGGAGASRPASGNGTFTPGVSAKPSWTGELEFSGGAIALPNQPPVSLGDIVLQSTQPIPPPAGRHGKPAPAPPSTSHDSFDLQPVSLDLGGKSPATVTGHVDDSGYTLHLTGSALPSRLLELGKAIPQLGEGLADCLPSPTASTDSTANTGSATEAADAPVHVDLTATRTWGSPQSWCPVPVSSSASASASASDRDPVH
ncbi:MAG TPA: AsmA family protein [Acidobacteriaceae bacterium]|nr:AsmA family protein [Acidobacteriaceae bacterium]